jgi:hypothetical protein
MTYSGRMKNGVAVFDAPVALPDGTRVRVEVDPAGSEFWSGKTVEELASEQGVEPPGDLSELAIDWPLDESVDDLLAIVREVRH